MKMNRYPLLLCLGLTLTLLLGAAFTCSNAKNSGGSDNTTSGDLKLGEYACYGSGGSILIGLGFKAQAGNRYTDLDGKEHGTFSISGDTVTFHGGHLDGQVGTNLHDYKFNIHSASCEPFK
jgi:hypothetical protein